ncbi:pentapeptide repeat-containing protein [Halobacteriota archaeon]
MSTCGYKFRNGEKCREETWQNSEFCIIHIELPEDEESGEFKRINELKDKKVEEKLIQKEFNFEGAKLFEVDFSGMKIKKNLDFNHSFIRKNVLFNGAEIDGVVGFGGAKIGEYALFEGAAICGRVLFEGAEIGGHAWFEGAKIEGDVWFGGAKIGGHAWFEGATIEGYAWFKGAKIGEDAWFEGANLKGDVNLDLTEIKGKLSFKDTTFENQEAQEYACRKAKNIWENLGDKDEADYYYSREMEVKRKQKKPVGRFFDLLIKYIYGYGTKWERILSIFFLVLFGFGLFLWIADGIGGADLGENIYSSIFTATNLRYVDQTSRGAYQRVAITLTLFGAFTWASLRMILARKYGRRV